MPPKRNLPRPLEPLPKKKKAVPSLPPVIVPPVALPTALDCADTRSYERWNETHSLRNRAHNRRRLPHELIVLNEYFLTNPTDKTSEVPILDHRHFHRNFSYTWNDHLTVRLGRLHVGTLLSVFECESLVKAIQKVYGSPVDWKDTFGLDDTSTDKKYSYGVAVCLEKSVEKAQLVASTESMKVLKQRLTELNLTLEPKSRFTGQFETMCACTTKERVPCQKAHIDNMCDSTSPAKDWVYHRKSLCLWVALEEGCLLGYVPAPLINSDSPTSYVVRVPVGCVVVVSPMFTCHFGTGTTPIRAMISVQQPHDTGGRKGKGCT